MMQRLRNLRTTATLVAGSALCVSALGIAAENDLQTTASDRASTKLERVDRAKPAKPTKVESTRGRIQLAPSGNGKPLPPGEAYPARRIEVDANLAFQMNPLNGNGMMFSPDGVPVLISLRPNRYGASWIGQVIGDERSTVRVISTRYGETGVVMSPRWGNWRFVPTQTGQSVIRSLPDLLPGWCGNDDLFHKPEAGLGGDPLPAGLRSGGLAGAGQCWADTDEQTLSDTPYWLNEDNADLSPPQSFATVINRFGDTCTGEPLPTQGPDTPDWTIRDDDCDGFATVDKVIDILFGYSQDALECFGDETSIMALAIDEVDQLNTVFKNSQMSIRARLVGVELGRTAFYDEDLEDFTPYRTSGGIPTDLDILYRDTQIQWRGLENLFVDLRDERGADIVTLLVCDVPGGLLGQAATIPMDDYSLIGENSPSPRISAWSAARAACVYSAAGTNGLTWQHEVGHLLGGAHGSPANVIEAQNNGEGQVPCQDYDGDPCELDPDNIRAFVEALPDEYHYGLRFPEVLEESGASTDQLFHSVMAYIPEYDPDSQPPPIHVPYFSNPFVTIPGTLSTTGVVNEDGICCIDDGENAANALVIENYVRADLDGFGGYPGIAQYRCNTIPYDCNQNGVFDTEEMDGVAVFADGSIDTNPDDLEDLDMDRAPDGCLSNPCFEDASAILVSSEQAGGLITDYATLESAVVFNASVSAQNEGWVLQPRSIFIEDFQHTSLSDLTIRLIHRRFGYDDATWTLFDCGSQLAGEGPAIVNGFYRFEAPQGSYSFDFLSRPTLCQVAQAGGIGGSGVVPSGIYRSQEALTANMSDPPRPIAGQWILQITDASAGDTGQYAKWGIDFQVIPYSSDCDGDGFPDACISEFTLATDCDVDGQSDSCQIAAQFDTLEVPYNDPDVDEDGDGNLLIEDFDSLTPEDLALIPTQTQTVPLLNDVDLNGRLDDCEDTTYWIDLGGPLVYDVDQFWGTVVSVPASFPQAGETGVRPRDGIVDSWDALYLQLQSPTAQLGGPNGRPDLYDILEDPSLDQNGNYIIDSLEIPGDCGINKQKLGCATLDGDTTCQAAVAASVAELDGTDRDGDGFNDTGIYCVTVSWDERCAALATAICDPALIGNCEEFSQAGCSDVICQIQVCALAAACCDVVWDANCATFADTICGGGTLCNNRSFDSAAEGLTGDGVTTLNYGTVTSTIVVPTAEDDGFAPYDEVVDGATVYGPPVVTITGLSHLDPRHIGLHLVHRSGGIEVRVPLIDFGCLEAGVPITEDAATTWVFREFGAGGSETLCESLTTSAATPAGGTFFPDGPLSAFLGMEAAGAWTLEMTDICCAGDGGFLSWDIQFTHTPPDDDGNFIADVCE